MSHPLEDVTEYTEVVEQYPLAGGCEKRSRALAKAIKRDAPSADVRGGYIECHNGLEPHWWVEIMGIDIEGVGMGEETVILDPSLHQFTESLFEEGLVDGYVPDAASHAPIAVIHEQDEMFDRYA